MTKEQRKIYMAAYYQRNKEKYRLRNLKYYDTAVRPYTNREYIKRNFGPLEPREYRRRYYYEVSKQKKCDYWTRNKEAIRLSRKMGCGIVEARRLIAQMDAKRLHNEHTRRQGQGYGQTLYAGSVPKLLPVHAGAERDGIASS